MSLKKRFSEALSNESGDPTVSTILLVLLVLIIAVAIFLFGKTITGKVTEATNVVNGITVGSPDSNW